MSVGGPRQYQTFTFTAARRGIPRPYTTAFFVVSQLALFFLLFQLYKIVRKTFIQRDATGAFDHALQIIRFQGRLGLNFELDLQRWVISQGEWLIWFFNRYYAYFMWAFYACAVVAMLLSPVAYRRWRRVFFLSMLLALPWYALYPLAPPRFMAPYGYPFIDTLAVYGPNYFSDTGIVQANRYAAMPSMHIGWTIIGACMLAAALPRWRLGALLGGLHVLLMSLTVMITGNHFVLDIVGGLLVVVASIGVAHLLPRTLPFPWRDHAKAA
ncbi:MAG: phosphatase PAP2 family protein [Chloroflexota bacterium]|nr:phosphatase PAP2 family protein [Chloroflexota bacterium]